MNIVVIGLGSMGKRRIRLIKKYDPDFQIFGIDTSDERRQICEKEYGIETYKNLYDLLKDNYVSCAFVCSEPLSHSSIISQCLEKEIHVFSELNLVSDGYDENIKLATENKLVLFLSSTFLYRNEIKKIKSFINNEDNFLNYTYHVGQYLPDWHPWENYNDFFVKDKRSNGCREIFALELPWLIHVFGDITNFYVVKNKISNLHIDYNDNYFVILEHSTGHKGMLAIDIVSRKAVRNLEIFSEKLFLQWDGTPNGLKVFDIIKNEDITINLYDKIDKLEQYNRFIIENGYYNEIEAFFAAVVGKEVPVYSFEKDKEILGIIDKIEA